MKRKCTHEQDTRKKRINEAMSDINKAGESDLAEDMLHEVFECLSHGDILNSCMLVCKKWKKVIEERKLIRLNLNEQEWRAFKSQSQRISEFIKGISIRSCAFIQGNMFRYESEGGTVLRLSESDFDGMDNLEEIYLERCSIGDELVNALVRREKLKKVSIMSRCVVSRSSLAVLSQSRNIKSISFHDVYEKSPTGSLRELFFIREEDAEEKIQIISSFTNINQLSVRVPHSDNTPILNRWNYLAHETRDRLFECLANCPSLRKLTIDGVDDVFCEYLARMKNITTLDITIHSTREISTQAVHPSLLENIKELTIVINSRNRMFTDGIMRLGQMHHSHPPTLESIRNVMGVAGGSVSCKWVESLPSRVSFLSVLGIQEPSAEFIDKLTSFTNLRGLSMIECDLIKAERLRHANLVYLDLEGSSISRGMLTDVLSMKNLRHLDIMNISIDHDSDINAPSFMHLSESDVEKLSICRLVFGNKLSDLTSLKITLPDNSSENALEGLGEMTSLRELSLKKDKPFPCATRKDYMDEIERLPSLTSLSLLNIHLTHETASAIAATKIKILRLEKVSLRAHHLSSLSAMRNLRHFEIVGERLWKVHLRNLALMDQLTTFCLYRSSVDECILSTIKSMSSLRTLLVSEWPHEKLDGVDIFTFGQ